MPVVDGRQGTEALRVAESILGTIKQHDTDDLRRKRAQRDEPQEADEEYERTCDSPATG